MEKHKPVLQRVRLFENGQQWMQDICFERAPYTFGYKIHSSCLVCPVCRRVWCEIQIGEDKIYHPKSVSCSDCAYIGPKGYEWLSTIPGCLLDSGTVCPDGVDWSMLEAMPQMLVERELYLLLAAAENCPAAFPFL